jgi:hypothetical protein
MPLLGDMYGTGGFRVHTDCFACARLVTARIHVYTVAILPLTVDGLKADNG